MIEGIVGAHHGEAREVGLRHQHAIEGIAVMEGEVLDVTAVGGLHGQKLDQHVKHVARQVAIRIPL